MKRTSKKIISLVMIVGILLSSLGLTTFAAQSDVELAKEMAGKIAAWQVNNVTITPGSTDLDGQVDWSAFACARGGYAGYDNYLDYIDSAVSANYDELYLTDVARIALAVDAKKGNAKLVGGHNLIDFITSANLRAEVHTAGISYALLALNAKSYGKSIVKKELVQILVAAQREDGGFNYLLQEDPKNIFSHYGDVDSTAMVLQALAPYAADAELTTVIARALAFVKAGQKYTGGFGGDWGASADTTAQALTALSVLGIDPMGTEYVKNGKTILDAVKTYQNKDGGIKGWDGKSDAMASYQMLYALSAYVRFAEGRTGLFDFSDTVTNVFRLIRMFFDLIIQMIRQLVRSTV
ncbi:MAG TPA: prenyltransferase/squalene oxidase repeat-containing protein [Clostridia bacterium]|nr:prenyltransferase/squalene oxidase repeat-containing protein [Clostridia bacterium]